MHDSVIDLYCLLVLSMSKIPPEIHFTNVKYLLCLGILWHREDVAEDLGKQECCPESPSCLWHLCCVSLHTVLNTSVP